MGDQGRLHLFDMLGARFEQAIVLQSHGDAALFRTTMQPGRLVPLHSHIDPESFYVLSGTIDVFLMDDEPGWRSVPAGSSIVIEDGLKHAVRNSAAAAADLMVLTNRRLGDYFQRVGRPVGEGSKSSPPAGDEIDHMIRVTREFGYWIASPDESEALMAANR